MKTSEKQQIAIHNHEVPGSSPGPATKTKETYKEL